VHVEIWSDIACRWCYAAKRRLAKALEAYEHSDEVTVTWRSFELEPGATYDAHRLVHLAAAHGAQDAMNERLMRAHFADGVDVRDPEVLTRLAAETGLPGEEVEETLEGDRYADAVRDDLRAASDLGIDTVPYFVADGKVGLAGAQEPAVLLEFLRRARLRAAAG
jgi:predicted DsbA family dithiol-disulfide isomerase